MKSFELIFLAEEISIQPYIDAVLWLLVITLCRSTVKKRKYGKKKYGMYILRSDSF